MKEGLKPGGSNAARYGHFGDVGPT